MFMTSNAFLALQEFGEIDSLKWVCIASAPANEFHSLVGCINDLLRGRIPVKFKEVQIGSNRSFEVYRARAGFRDNSSYRPILKKGQNA